jgi:hypothetical protein
MTQFQRKRGRAPRAAATSRLKSEAGVTLIETVVATGLLLLMLAGLVSASFVATTSTENQGHLSARATEYAQDKMEQLLVLAYGDVQSDTTQFPASNAGGTGLAVGGGLNPAAPVNGYVDYLDVNGNLLGGGAAPAAWYYKRVWQVTSPSANLKQITVTATVKWSLGGTQQQPASSVTALKTFPF